MRLIFDVGATRTRIALADEQKNLKNVEYFTTDSSSHGLKTLLKRLQLLALDYHISAIAGGMPGQIDSKTGIITGVMNMPAWDGAVIQRPFERLFHCPVYLRNDVVMGGLGEAWFGAGKTDQTMVYFTVSTGVNAVRIIKGRVDESIVRYDVGQELLPNPEGGVSTLESLVGGAAFESRHGVSPAEVRDGRTWRAEEHHLARGIYNALIYWTPDLVVLGGSMMRDIEIDKLAEELKRLPELSSWPVFAKAKLGDKAGLYGALALLDQMT